MRWGYFQWYGWASNIFQPKMMQLGLGNSLGLGILGIFIPKSYPPWIDLKISGSLHTKISWTAKVRGWSSVSPYCWPYPVESVIVPWAMVYSVLLQSSTIYLHQTPKIYTLLDFRHPRRCLWQSQRRHRHPKPGAANAGCNPCEMRDLQSSCWA